MPNRLTSLTVRGCLTIAALAALTAAAACRGDVAGPGPAVPADPAVVSGPAGGSDNHTTGTTQTPSPDSTPTTPAQGALDGIVLQRIVRQVTTGGVAHDTVLAEPAAGAAVRLDASPAGATPAGTAQSDAAGRFHFGPLADGNYTVRATKAGASAPGAQVSVIVLHGVVLPASVALIVE